MQSLLQGPGWEPISFEWHCPFFLRKGLTSNDFISFSDAFGRLAVNEFLGTTIGFVGDEHA